MPEKTFTVPDIYPEFKCKISSCRQTCCYGWEITFGMEEYFRLIGMNCPRDLRKRIDGSVYVLDHPTRERYAVLAKRYDGECPMHDPDGYCALQRHCGEDALTDVCRFYPRSPHTRHANECSVAASCEAVCELLFAKKEPISFINVPLDFRNVFTTAQDDDIRTKFYVPIRKRLVSVMQKRDVPLSARLSFAAAFAAELDVAFEKGADAAEALLSTDGASPSTEKKPTDFSALGIAVKLLSGFDFRHSVYPFAQKAAENLGFETESFPENYEKAKSGFEKAFPEWERMFENVLVNHFFYEGLPFSDDGCSFSDNMKAMCAVYGIWRTAAVGYTMTSPDMNSLVDVTAAFFRLAENSPLPTNLARAMKSGNELSACDFSSL